MDVKQDTDKTQQTTRSPKGLAYSKTPAQARSGLVSRDLAGTVDFWTAVPYRETVTSPALPPPPRLSDCPSQRKRRRAAVRN